MGVIVHSMGKCGSTSIHQSLKLAGIEVAHCHYLGTPNKDKAEAQAMIEAGRAEYVIVPIREPVRRNQSAYYQNYRDARLFGVKAFLQDYPHEIPLVWMDRELVGYWGLDVYAQPFDKQRGWRVYGKFLVIRCENLTRGWKDAYQALTGTDAPKLHKRKVETSGKYMRFVAEGLPEDYIKAMHESQYYRHFYE